MSAPFGNPLDEQAAKRRNARPQATQEIEYTVVGSLLTRPELWPEVEFLDRGDFIDGKLGDAFEAARVLIRHGKPVNDLTVAACAAGDVSPERMDAYEREMGGYLLMVQQDRGYRTNLTAEAKLLRKHRLNRERKDAAGREEWGTVQRLSEAIAALDKPTVQPSMTAAELWAKDFPPLKWLVEGVLPEGVTLLVSPPKVGKTRLATQLGISLASGGYALNHPDHRAAKTEVFILALESGDRRAQKDLKQLSESPPDGLHFSSTWARLSEGGAADLERWLDAHPGVSVLILDTLAKVRDKGHGGKGFLYSLDYDVGAAIKGIADKRGLSVLILHHTNKLNLNQGADLLECISGSTGVTGSVDHILIIQRERLQPDGLLTLITRDYEDRAWAMRYERGLWTLVGTPEEAAEAANWRGDGESDARQQILDLLRQSPMDPKEIAERLGKNRGAIRYLLMRLCESGKIVRRMDGRYITNTPNTHNTANSTNSTNSHTKNMAVSGSGEPLTATNSENYSQAIDNAKESIDQAVSVRAVRAVSGVLEDSHVHTQRECDLPAGVPPVETPPARVCATCRHLDADRCQLRGEVIEQPEVGTCLKWEVQP